MIELNREVISLQQQVDELTQLKSKLESRLSRFTRFDGVSFGGIKVAQIWADFVLWEAMLNERKFRAIIELGTGFGGFSWWLWAQAQVRSGMNFYTYDAITPDREPPYFERKDIFADARELGHLMRLNEPCIVFCDNGNKPRELQTFAEELATTESLLVAHDWGTEFMPEDIPDSVEMIWGDYCEELGSISRVFRRKENR